MAAPIRCWPPTIPEERPYAVMASGFHPTERPRPTHHVTDDLPRIANGMRRHLDPAPPSNRCVVRAWSPIPGAPGRPLRRADSAH